MFPGGKVVKATHIRWRQPLAEDLLAGIGASHYQYDPGGMSKKEGFVVLEELLRGDGTVVIVIGDLKMFQY